MDTKLKKHVHLSPRLEAIAEMLSGVNNVADVGCDHGRLSVALVQRGIVHRVRASDISEVSLNKARRLARICGVSSDIRFESADGLECLTPGEADGIIMAGMGGELIAKMLEKGGETARCAKRLVLQPMRGAEELRYYLNQNNYDILDERLVLDSGRIYQVICAHDGTPEQCPQGFPKDALYIGWRMAVNRDPLLPTLINSYRRGIEKRLAHALAAGSRPPALIIKLKQLDEIEAFMEGYNDED